MLETGIKGVQTVVVDETNTATAYGSGDLPVFGTPAMIALMEFTALRSIAPHLSEDSSSVGVSVDIRHLAATPIGVTVRCESELITIDGRKLTFTVHAFDNTELIGEGTHERFIINKDKFLEKTNRKREP